MRNAIINNPTVIRKSKYYTYIKKQECFRPFNEKFIPKPDGHISSVAFNVGGKHDDVMM